ncbi:MAG: heparan-alpha-glucosaminide N-acetyltransferase domain-containing protein [Candidatus Thermoplasmatota archaeon]|nr:heparan-alpha-glucosaminide N-acetyltransferase domain-containing protein [Candidatus Thermoplasmatota archaeon]
MKRFVSLDLMRGLAIFMMVIFHIPMRWYDRSWMDSGGTVEIHPIPLALALSILFFGAWAGFFLMVSAAANTISMQRNLEKGKGPLKVMLFQVIGGLLLLVMAFLVESTIGYHGYLGELVKGNDRWDMVLWRGFHMETIHTIALCIILNGIVHGILSMRGGHKKMGRNIAIYAILAIIVVGLTPAVYELSREAYTGYPFREYGSELLDRDIYVQYPVIGETPAPEIGVKFILMALAGQPEPLFPYLALSFLGSIVGIVLTSGDKRRRLPRYGILSGLSMFIVGAAGSGYDLMTNDNAFPMLADHFYEMPGLYPDLWFWWFMLISGSFIMAIILVLRLVEYRGRSREFAERTLFLRRYGFVAFTVYTYQFIDVLPRLGLEVIPVIHAQYPYPSRMTFLPVLILVPLTVILWEFVLRTWEKADYVLGMEWILSKVSEYLIPSRRDRTNDRSKWWMTPRLNAREYLYEPQWMDMIDREEVDPALLRDSKLALILSMAGFTFPLLSPIALHLSKASSTYEGWNKFNRVAVAMSISSILIWMAVLIILLYAPPVVI